MDAPVMIDVSGLGPSLAALEVAVATAVPGPGLQGLAAAARTTVQAAMSTAAVPDAAEGEWNGFRSGDHMTIAGQALTIVATLAAGGPVAIRLSTETRTVQCDYGDPAARATVTGLIESAATGGISAVGGRLGEAATGMVSGALGAVRVRVADDGTTVADYSFGLEIGPRDNLDFDARIAEAETDLRRQISTLGTPGETVPGSTGTGSVVSGATGISAAGAIGSAAAAAAATAARRIAQRAAESARQRAEVEEQGATTPPPPPSPAPREVEAQETTTPTPPFASCAACGGRLEEDDRFCPQCGVPVPEPAQVVECGNCRATLAPDDRFCSVCGTAVKIEEPATAAESESAERLVAATPAVTEGPRSGHAGSEASVGESPWIYVTTPVEVRGLHDTSSLAGALQPGHWYLVVTRADPWVHVQDPDGRIEGWVPADRVHSQVEASPVGTAVEPARPATAFVATHRTPEGGMAAWARPDPQSPTTAQLSGELELSVVEELGAWAHVRASNGWEGWVDARLLLPAGATKAAPAPTRRGVPASLRDAPIPALASAAIVICTFLPWVGGGGGNAFDVPISFLWSIDASSTTINLGLVLLVIGAAGLASVVLPAASRYRRLFGSAVVLVTIVFFAQLLRLLADFYGWGDGALRLLGEQFGIGAWSTLVAGIALALKGRN